MSENPHEPGEGARAGKLEPSPVLFQFRLGQMLHAIMWLSATAALVSAGVNVPIIDVDRSDGFDANALLALRLMCAAIFTFACAVGAMIGRTVICSAIGLCIASLTYWYWLLSFK